MFHCSSSENAIDFQKKMNKIDFRVSTIRMDNNTSRFIQTSQYRVGIILKTSCTNWTTVFEHFDSNLFKKSKYSWFIFTDDFSSTSETLSTYPIEIDSDITIISQTENYYYLYEVYNTGYYKNGRFRVEHVGYWYYKLWVQPNKRMDLSGVKLKSTVVVTHNIEHETFEEYLSMARPEVDSLHKLKYFTLLMYLTDMYNFSFELQRTNSWGYLTNGSFDGMVGTLQRGEADFGGSPVFIRADRAKFIHYVTETWPSKPSFIFRHPKHPGGFSTIYTRPLADQVWFCILAVLALASSILCILLRLKAIMFHGDEADSSASLALLSVWSAVCQQGMTVNRHAVSVKLVLFSSFLFSLFVYQYYNALVVSTLLRVPPVTIRTLGDLLHSKLKAGVEDTLYNRDYLRRTTDPLALEIYSRKIAAYPRPNFYSPEQGMALVKKGGFAFHTDPAFAYPIIRRTFTERENCELQQVQMYPPQNMYAVTKKGSPYSKHLSYGIRRMAESGLMQRLRSTMDEPKPRCIRTPDSSVFSVTIREFSVPLIILATGVVAATTILLLELLFFKIKGKKIQFRQ
uniref:Ionotropic receptor IR30 n=1 Tax=Lobesia botrana TaxID=209534 RepID=A0A345BF37_9NEOP|nr:ionotropic receptor IR30 [Lobesia botrana]